MIIVMLSQPTPPVSELEARQLSIMFSQIFSRSCLEAMPRRTNSMTAWEDWQSQIPNKGHGRQYIAAHIITRQTERRFTVTRNHQEFIIFGQVVHDDVWIGGNNLLLRGELCALFEFEVANGPGKGEVAIDTSKVDEAAGGSDSCLFTLTGGRRLLANRLCVVWLARNGIVCTFILGLVVEREGLCTTLDTQHTSGVTSVGLVLFFCMSAHASI